MSNCSTCPSNGACTKDKESCGIVNNPLNNIKNVIGIMSGKINCYYTTCKRFSKKRL